MTRRHGPDFEKQTRPLSACGECQGRGVVKGLFYEMPCDGCWGSGFVDAVTGERLEVEELVLQLGRALRLERQQAENRSEQSGAERDYQGDGGRHGLRGHWTGD